MNLRNRTAILICIFLMLNSLAANAQDVSEAGKKITLEFGEIISVESKMMKESRDLFIVLPNNYEESEQSYPVLYVLDGSPFMMAWVYPSLFNRGTPPLIVVGIGNVDRNRDMYFVEVGEPRPTAGHAEDFLKVIKEEIIPYIDSTYRTSKYRAISGGSAAGAFATWAFIKEPGLFDGCIAISPVLGHSYPIIDSTISAYPDQSHVNARKLVFVYNENDLTAVNGYTPAFRRSIQEKAGDSIEITEKVIPLQGHYSSVDYPIGMTELFSDFRLPVFTTSEFSSEIKTHFRKLEEKYGLKNVAQYLLTPNELRTAANGYVLKKQYSEGISLLEFAIQQFPKSSQLLFYKAQFLELMGKREKAAEFYAQAIKMNNDDTITWLSKNMLINAR